ncbi:MAG: hypothetical protein AAGH79_12420 [Bacteroidota bacterium]
MLQYFRQFRRNLLDKGALRKYLLYALGEILLIVLGIVIATQLNVLNEARKQAEEQDNLIERLKRQIEINQYQAKESIAEIQVQVDQIAVVLAFMGAPAEKINDVYLDSLMASVIEDHHLGLDLTTLQEALDNGEVSDLDDKDLRTSLYALLKANERLEQREEIANFDNNNFAIPFFYKHTNLRNTAANTDQEYQQRIGYSKLEPNDYVALLSNREFENLVESRFYYAQEMRSNYERVASFLDYLAKKLQE